MKTFLALFFLFLRVVLGPLALGYVLSHLLPLATHHSLVWTFWKVVAVGVVGFFLPSISIPAAMVIWMLVVFGFLT